VPNNFVFADWVCMETLRSLINKSQVAQFFNTDYNKEFKKNWAVGDTVRVKYPQRFLIVNGLGYQEQPIDRRYTTVAINQVFGVHFGWDDMEAALKLERPNSAIKDEYIDKAAEQLAAELDARCGLWASQNTPNIVGTLGVTPTQPQTYHAANTRMLENSALSGERGLVITPQMQETLAVNALPQFNPQSDISKIWKEGSLGKFAGFESYVSVNGLFSQTAGTIAGANTTTGANQSGASLLITATAGDTYNVGDVFTLALTNNVNPVSRRSVGRLKQFTVTVPLTCAGGGADLLQFLPAIEGPGSQYQNVDALPGALAAITMYPGTTSPNGKTGMQGLALTKNAFALVGVPLEKPVSQEMASSMRDPATGLAVRFVKSWDQPTSSMRHRLEMAVGFGNLYNDQGAVRILSQA
jgi:hypothetical protein